MVFAYSFFYVLIYWFHCKAKALKIDFHEYDLDKSLPKIQKRLESGQLIKKFRES